MKTQRIFIAIKIANTEEIRTLFRQLQLDLRQERVKWVDMDGLHVTLLFIGETDLRKIKMIKNRLQKVANKYQDFPMQVKALGAFPSMNYPRILWAGIEVGEPIYAIQKEIMMQLEYIVPMGDKRFSPHMTLGRIKQGVKDPKSVAKILQKYENWEDEEFQVEKIVLMESKMSKQGPEYKVIDEFNFKSRD